MFHRSYTYDRKVRFGVFLWCSHSWAYSPKKKLFSYSASQLLHINKKWGSREKFFLGNSSAQTRRKTNNIKNEQKCIQISHSQMDTRSHYCLVVFLKRVLQIVISGKICTLFMFLNKKNLIQTVFSCDCITFILSHF